MGNDVRTAISMVGLRPRDQISGVERRFLVVVLRIWFDTQVQQTSDTSEMKFRGMMGRSDISSARNHKGTF